MRLGFRLSCGQSVPLGWIHACKIQESCKGPLGKARIVKSNTFGSSSSARVATRNPENKEGSRNKVRPEGAITATSKVDALRTFPSIGRLENERLP